MHTALILLATVRHCSPAISRRVVVPATITLPELHIVLQILYDWEDSHLWQFSFGKVDFMGEDEDIDDFAATNRECRGASPRWPKA